MFDSSLSQTFSFPAPLFWILYFPSGFGNTDPLLAELQVPPPWKDPQDEPNLPSAVAIRQCKTTLGVVCSLSNLLLVSHLPFPLAGTQALGFHL